MKISVIVPCYNTESIVERSINAIFNQTLSKSEYEVIVVDDASTDSMQLKLQELKGKFTFEYFRNVNNKGAASTRNIAVSHAHNELIVFIQDDIIVEKEFLEIHQKAHLIEVNNQNAEKRVVVGYTYWDQQLKKTPFLDYLDKGQQFDYERFQQGDKAYAFDGAQLIPADHLLFYTSNISFKKSFFQSVGEFDEQFYVIPGVAAYEDTELGWRLKEQGMNIFFCPQARASHFHQRTLESMSKRRFAEGVLTHLLYKKHPNFSWRGDTQSFWYNLKRLKFAALANTFRFWLVLLTSIIFNPILLLPLEKIAHWAQYRLNVPLLYKIVLGYHYNVGYWTGKFKVKVKK